MSAIAERSGAHVSLLTPRAFWELTEEERVLTACGDSLGALVTMPSAYADAFITDGPYSSGGAFRGDRAQSTSDKYVSTGVEKRTPFAGDVRDQRSFSYWVALVFAECLRVAKPGAVLCAFCDWRQLGATQDAVQAGGWVMRGVCVWDKTEATRPRIGGFRSQCEFIVWGSSGPLPQTKDVGCLAGCFRIKRNSGEDRIHQTGKPVPLMEHLVSVASPGGIVIDPFMGSGSTGVACIHTGRSFIGVELLPTIEQQARDRLRDAVANRMPCADARQAGLFEVSP